MSSGIIVSGYEADFVAFKAPSGQWNVNLDAFLVSLNAGFGFNLSPHRFSLQFIPTAFNGASGKLPQIGTYTTYEVRPGACEVGLWFAGNVVHADYENSTAGTVIRIDIEDRRKDILDQVKITTEDLGNNIPSGMMSIGQWYRVTTGFTDASGNIQDSKVKEYRNITELGATYQQIWESLNYGTGIGRINVDVSKLPTPTQISANLRGSTEPLRFKFIGSPLSEVISSVCSDSSYDWYWGMRDDSVKLVNRRITFDVSEDSLPIQTFNPNSVTFRFGKDSVQSPGRVRVLGANREGILNSRLLSPIDGITEPNIPIVFTPAWNSISVGFYDAHGVYRSYRPTERELQMALKSIEHWTYYKKYQSGVFSDGVDAGYTAAQDTTFQSRLDPIMPLAEFYNNPSSGLRQIANRIDAEHNWVLEWYASVAQHAGTHYGRTYVLRGVLFNVASGEFGLLDAAWCNLENQIKPGATIFSENYEINPLFGPVSPFITEDFKIRAHVVLPSSAVYGNDGFAVPAAFSDWNEDAHPSGDRTFEHYVPVSLKRVGQRVINPRAENNLFEDYPEGTVICQLPVIAGSGRKQNSILANLVTLHEIGVFAAQSGIQDFEDPTILIQAFSGLSGVAIPVQLRERYGQSYPVVWSSGTGSGTRDSIIVNDNIAPWFYFPVGSSTSVEVMSNRVSGLMEAQVIGVTESRYAEIEKIDWPFIGFDEFANQDAVSGVYGRRDHGVTDISTSYNNGVPNTRYGIKSFFPEFGKDAPLGERNIGVLNNIIHPIDFTTLDSTRQDRPTPDNRPIGGEGPFGIPIPPVGIRKEVYAVTITEVINRGDTVSPERYRSVTKDGIPKPGGAVDPLDSDDLICRDGFLNVGDHCLYHVEYKSNGARRRFYTGGTDLTQGAAVVEVSSIDSINNQVDITYRGFTIPAVTVIDGASISTISTGDKGSLQTDGTAHTSNNANITGLRPEVDAPSGVYFIPVEGGTSSVATPVIIKSISSFATSGALATVQTVTSSGTAPFFVGSGGTDVSNVKPLPYAQFAQSGDIGVLTQNASGEKFVFINRQAFSAFNGN